jgi:uncharacterized membrane protein YqjE
MDGDTRANLQTAMQGRPVAGWASVFLDYVELKGRLVAVESKEASSHFTGLLVMAVIVLILAVASVLLYAAFLLYAIAALLHLAWGWSALICGAILTVAAIIVFFVLRSRLRKPVFQMTLKDLEKDKEWLTQAKTRTP